jgi:prolyl-tRNA synthetase
MALAPFQVLITPVEWNPGTPVTETALALYGQLRQEGLEVLLDDRDERPGIKFKDADLVGIPLRLTVGSKGLAEGKVELRQRRTKETVLVEKDRAAAYIKGIVNEALLK